MDTNKDGHISLSELFSDLPAASLYSPTPVARSRILRAKLHRRSRSKGELTTSSHSTPPTDNGDTWLFASVKHSHDGAARSEDVIHLWENIGVESGEDIFLSLGLNPHGQVNLLDLISALDDALKLSSSPESILSVAFLWNQQEVKYLKSLIMQSQEENKKLRLNMSEANAQNVLLANEVDDRLVQVDKSWESKLLLVDTKYQEQIKAVKSEVERVRDSGATEISNLRAELEVQTKSAQEKQQIVEKLTTSQKEMANLEKALEESSEKMVLLRKRNENLKKDLQNKLQVSEIPEDYKQKLLQQKTKLIEACEEIKKLKDDNDVLMSELEKAQQKLQLSQRRVVSVSSRSLLSPIETSGTDEEDPTSDDSSALQKLDKRRQSLSKELIECQTKEIIEQELNKIEQRYKLAVNALENKHNAEKMRMVESFDQEKKLLIDEQKTKEETLLDKQLSKLLNAFIQEKNELVHKHESEKSYINHHHKKDIETLQTSLQEAESYIEDNVKGRHFVHSLEVQLARCHEDIHNLENQKSDFDAQLWQQKMMLRSDFEEERKNLEEQFLLEFEQQETRHKLELQELFHRGAESLTGKLRDDFLSLVWENIEKEVVLSQSAILNQLQKDRSKMVIAFEREKLQIYEKVGKEKHSLIEKYELQISTLQTELSHLQSQLETEKQMLSEVSLKSVEDAITSDNAVEHLRTKMEGELVIKLAQIKESFEMEKKVLESEKTIIEEKLTELQRLLVVEKKKNTEVDMLKEMINIMRAHRKDNERIIEENKERLFQEYQQMKVERFDVEIRLQAVRDEGESQGRMEGLFQGRKEGRQEGYEEGFRVGTREGQEAGFNEGKKYMDEATNKSLENMKGRQEGYEEGFRVGTREGQEAGFNEGKKYMDEATNKSLENMKALIDTLKQENIILDSELRQEKEKRSEYSKLLQDLDQMKSSFDLLIEEKCDLETKYTESLATLVDKHQAEKTSLVKEMKQLEAQSLSIQSDKSTVESQTEAESQTGAVHHEITLAKEGISEEITETEFDTDSSKCISLKEQMILLSNQLKETLTVQNDYDTLKKDHEALLQDRNKLDTTDKVLQSKPSDDNAKSLSHLSQIQTLNEEKQKMYDLLDQTSKQLVKDSTSMALAQSKFVRELESMKQKAKSMIEVESYTKLQISLVEHQRLVINLQNTARERESMVNRVIKEAETETRQTTQIMQTTIQNIQSKLDSTQEELITCKEKYNQKCIQSNQRNMVLKDLYVQNSDLMTKLADSEVKRKCSEQLCRKLNGKCETYKKIIDRVYSSLSR